MHLTHDTYDEAEQIALVRVPNRIIEACRPLTFAHVGYPTQVTQTAALARYTEAMHERRVRVSQEYLGGFTDREVKLFKSVARLTADMTERLYGRRRIPRGSLVDAFHLLRHIEFLFPDQSPSVFEIGAGSGYLGALLGLIGVRYSSTDIAQALYLFQNNILTEILGSRLCELATTNEVDAQSLALHIPWWKFYLPEGKPPIDAKVIVCNNALCEMHFNARDYLMRVVSDHFSSHPDAVFVFAGIGAPVANQPWEVFKSALQAGLRVGYHDNQFTILIGNQHVDAPHAFFNQQIDSGFQMPAIASPASGLASALLEGRKRVSSKAQFKLADIEPDLRSILGSYEVRSDDELFLAFISSRMLQ